MCLIVCVCVFECVCVYGFEQEYIIKREGECALVAHPCDK